jgi:hypothetical protein
MRKSKVKDCMNTTSIAMTPAITKSICCPLRGEPFQSAQALNCSGSHNVSLSAALQCFGAMQLDGQCEKPSPCPVCRERITAYRDNHGLQAVVDAILGVQKGAAHLDKMSAMIQQLNLGFNTGQRYPIVKTPFCLRTSSLSEEYISLTLDHQSRSERADSAIEVLAIGAEVFPAGLQYCLSIHFGGNMFQARDNLLAYLEKQQIREIKVGSSYCMLEIFRSDDYPNFISCLRLLIQENDFDQRSSDAIAKFLAKLEKLHQTDLSKRIK